MKSAEEIQFELQSLPGIEVKNKAYFRLLDISCLNNLLSSIGSKRGGRYNLFNTFEVLYMAPDPKTAMEETMSQLNSRFRPKILITIDITVQVVLNLEDPKVLTVLEIDKNQLFYAWYVPLLEESVTQMLGRLVYESKRFEGIRYPSTKIRNEYNLGIFPDRMKKGSKIRVYDPDEIYEESIVGKL